MNNAFELVPLTVEAKGEVISSNVKEVREMVRAALANINRSPSTDEEFGQAELDVKSLKGAEERFQKASQDVLSQAAGINALLKELSETSEEVRTARLELEKAVAKRKEEVKTELIEEFLTTFDIDATLARKHYLPGLQTAIKGKRTIESMRTACRDFVTKQQGLISRCREILDRFEKAHGADLISDRRELELETPEGLEAELRRRFEAKRAREEKARLEKEAAEARAAERKALAEAEAAKKAAEAPAPAAPMKGMLPPSDLPEPPKIGAIPVGKAAAAENVVPFELNNETTAAEEWAAFRTAAFTSFGVLKAARELLKHDENKERATIFRDGVNAAWAAANRGTEVAK